VRPDFLIETDDDRILAIEARSWSASRESYRRARTQANYFKQAIGATDAWVVLLDAATDLRAGVVAYPDLAAAIGKWVAGHRVRTSPDQPKRPFLFAAMPFAREFDDVYFVAMVGASDAIGHDCLRTDYSQFVGDVTQQIEKLVRQSVGVIADLTGSNPNVMYEVGFARARRLDIVSISSTDPTALAFDVRGWNILRYAAGGTHRLRQDLEPRLRSVFGPSLGT
jgi:hypothetical protein